MFIHKATKWSGETQGSKMRVTSTGWSWVMSRQSLSQGKVIWCRLSLWLARLRQAPTCKDRHIALNFTFSTAI
eukprot:1160084-Pelagomonas_calceolata.AAC.4